MLSMQQLEELESRVVKALQLISDLRTDNAKLENDNESLKSENEDLKLTLDEKEQEVARIRKELDESTRELQELKDKEEVLEKKIISLLGKLDVVQSGPIPAGDAPARPKSRPQPAPVIVDEPFEDEIRVEKVKPAAAKKADEDEDVIIIDDESDIEGDEIKVEKVEGEGDEDEIILRR